MNSQSTVKQHTTTAPRAMPARWGTQQFMNSHARFVDSPRNQTTQPEHRFLHWLSAHESASMEIIGEVYQYNSSDCLIIKHVNFFFFFCIPQQPVCHPLNTNHNLIHLYAAEKLGFIIYNPPRKCAQWSYSGHCTEIWVVFIHTNHVNHTASLLEGKFIDTHVTVSWMCL